MSKKSHKYKLERQRNQKAFKKAYKQVTGIVSYLNDMASHAKEDTEAKFKIFLNRIVALDPQHFNTVLYPNMVKEAMKQELADHQAQTTPEP